MKKEKKWDLGDNESENWIHCLPGELSFLLPHFQAQAGGAVWTSILFQCHAMCQESFQCH